MNLPARVTHVGLWCLCLVLAIGVIWLLNLASIPDERKARQPLPPLPKQRDSAAILAQDPIEDGGFAIASQFTAPIHDTGSLRELREAIQVRGPPGLAVLQAEFAQTRLPFRAPDHQVAAVAQLLHQIGLLNLFEGRYSEAAACFQKALELGRPSDIPERDRARLMALLGITALRQGDVSNGLGASSSIFPIALEAAHTQQSGSREAVKRFTAYLKEWPEDLRIRWLLNVACMTLGEYPGKVPPEHLISLDSFRSTLDVGRFENVASRVGLNARGPNQAGGSVFDDFNGDGLPDLFTTSLDVDRGASLFINRGDG